MGTARINNQPTVATPLVGRASYYTGAPANASVGTANHIAVFPFNLYYSQTITNLSIDVQTSGGAQLYDMGIYDIGGNLLGHVGAQTMTNTATATTLALTAAITIGPGTYLFAVTGNGTTAKFVSAGGANGLFIYDTATLSTSGVLPNSITLTNTTPSTTSLPAAAQWSNAGQPILFMLT